MQRRHVRLGGEVQGVFFRAEAQERARGLRVAGWIRNLPDGRVEAVFEGSPDAVESMVAWCRTGPPEARVTEIDIEEEPPEGLDRFEVRRTPR
jgi:acylphosphatase